MNVGDERSRSLWMDVQVAPDAAPLNRDLRADTVVIGAASPGSLPPMSYPARDRRSW